MKLKLKHAFDLRLTCLAHGWINLSPFQWNDGRSTLNYTIRDGCATVTVTVNQPSSDMLFVKLPQDVSVNTSRALACAVRRILMLDWDPVPAFTVARRRDKSVAHILEEGGGRLLRGSTSFEDVVKTICTINTSWNNTTTIVRSLVCRFGKGAFPQPVELLEVGEDQLRAKTGVGYRARTILEVSRLAQGRDLDSVPLARLGAIKGLGTYAIDHLRVLRGDYSRIPVDAEVRAYCSRHLRMAAVDDEAIQRRFEDWGNYRFLGYKFGRVAAFTNWLGG